MSKRIHVVTLATDAPVIKEDPRKDFVAYGEDNLFFDYLINRKIYSTTNGAVIDGKVKMIYGKGLAALNSAKKIEDIAKLPSLIPGHELKKVIQDRVLFEIAAFKVKDGERLEHFPMKTLRAGKKNEMGKITAWYYHPDWKKYKDGDELSVFYPYEKGSNKKNQIIIVAPYAPGYEYYPPVCYSGALPYALLEEEIGDYLVNDVQNGFSGTKVINFNNGVPSENEQRLEVNRMEKKFTGAKGKRLIFSFQDSPEEATTVEDIALNDAPDHYQYLSEEAERKILKAHKAPSVLLGFNADNTGLANNAEELRNKMIAFDNYEIKPYQIEMLDILEKFLADQGIQLNLYFKTIEPLEFSGNTDTEEAEEDAEMLSLAADALNDFLNKGERLDDEDWELIDERDVDYDLEDDFDSQVREWEEKAREADKPSLLEKAWNLVSTGRANPKSRSEQDEQIGDYYYRVRYFYHPRKVSGNSRPFCVAMVAADKVFRKEDIIALEDKPVNPGWGPNGVDTYEIWKYKGGGDCHHRWRRMTFRSRSRFRSIEDAEKIGTGEAAVAGYRITNDWEVSVRPTDMPNGGFLKPNRGRG